jgi:hypothetical protein
MTNWAWEDEREGADSLGINQIDQKSIQSHAIDDEYYE